MLGSCRLHWGTRDYARTYAGCTAVSAVRLDSDPRESCNWARHVACKCLRFLAAQLIINAWTFSLDLTGLWFASLRLASVCFHFQMQITLWFMQNSKCVWWQHAPAARHEKRNLLGQLLIGPCSSAAIAMIESQSELEGTKSLLNRTNWQVGDGVWGDTSRMGVFSIQRFYSSPFEANRKAASAFWPHWPPINQERHEAAS